MKKILPFLLIVCALSFSIAAKQKTDIRDFSYAIPKISGIFGSSELGVVSGITLAAKIATIQTDDSTSYLTFQWSKLEPKSLGKNPKLRLCLASVQRTFQYLEVKLANNNKLLGTIDLSISTSFQLLEFSIQDQDLTNVLDSGVKISCRGKGKPVSFFVPSAGIPSAFCPHLLLPGHVSAHEAFLMQFASRASLSIFGWEEGCVLDGLAMIAAKNPKNDVFKRALIDHLQLSYPVGLPSKTITSIEATLGIAQLANQDPTNHEIKNAINFWESREDKKGSIIDGSQVTAEGSYTIAWPLAVLSVRLKSPDFAEKCVAQLRIRRDRLVDEGGAMWLRNSVSEDPVRSYKLWSRGVAWYILGLAKSLDILENPPADLIKELQRAAAFIIPLQTKEGLWRVFADDPETALETSGTSGIATALAIGARRGWLNHEAEKSARKALKGLYKKLTPDGFLTCVANGNAKEGGENFQRKTQGVILKFGMGLMAQLVAELEP